MLAVTTRNRLHGPRYFPHMLLAWRQIRRQLYATPGMLRYTTAVAGPTEFFTLTIWRDRQALFAFSSSGAHERMMWQFARWSRSFWSMRWLPTGETTGAWSGWRAPTTAPPPPESGPGWLRESPIAAEIAPFFDTGGRPDRRNPDARGAPAAMLLARIPLAFPHRLVRLRRAAACWRAEPEARRVVVGVGLGEALVLSLFCGDTTPLRAQMGWLEAHAPDGWGMLAAPGEYEVGHWEGLRVRQMGRGKREPGVAPRPQSG